MTKNQKIWAGVVAFIVILVGWRVYQRSKITSTFKIGAILPLTGDLASLGEAAKNATLLAYADLSAAEKDHVELLFGDDHFDPKATITIFNKLVGVDGAKAIICLTSGPCAAVAPLAEQYQIPLIAIASNPKIQKDKKFVFRLEIAPSQEAEVLSNYINSKNLNRIASIVAVHDGVQAAYGAIHSRPSFSGKEVDNEAIAPDQKDFRTVITKMLSKKPDVILVGLLPGMSGEFGRQARALGYGGDFIGFNFLEGQETLVAARGTLDGIVYTNAKNPQDWFAQKYFAAYHVAYSEGAPHAFDAVSLILKAYEAGKTTNVTLADYLGSIKSYDGALGIFDSTGGHEFTIPVGLKTIRGNSFVAY